LIISAEILLIVSGMIPFKIQAKGAYYMGRGNNHAAEDFIALRPPPSALQPAKEAL